MKPINNQAGNSLDAQPDETDYQKMMPFFSRIIRKNSETQWNAIRAFYLRVFPHSSIFN